MADAGNRRLEKDLSNGDIPRVFSAGWVYELPHGWRIAGMVRARYHEPDRATYMVMRIINYTNVCVAQCDYCAFYVLPNQEGGYVLSRDDNNLLYGRMLLESGFDLSKLNPKAADFHLVIGAAEALNIAVR